MNLDPYLTVETAAAGYRIHWTHPRGPDADNHCRAYLWQDAQQRWWLGCQIDESCSHDGQIWGDSTTHDPVELVGARPLTFRQALDHALARCERHLQMVALS